MKLFKSLLFFAALFVSGNLLALQPPKGTSSVKAGGPASVSSLTVNGSLVASSNTVIDAYNPSFGAVTAGSTGTVTWTEVTDRLGEFVTSSFTVTMSGYYEITANSGVSQTAGSACLLIKNNGTLVTGGEACNQGVTALASILDVSVSRILNLTAGNVIRVDASATTSNATFVKATLTIKKVP